jgi:hypothetical protein
MRARTERARRAGVLFALLLAAACARAPDDEDRSYLDPHTLPKDPPGWAPSRDLERVIKDTGALEGRLGIYPQFASQEERVAAYREWRVVLLDARVVARPADGYEGRMWVLGELYRLGHVLGLRGAAELADDNLSACVAQFPDSQPCNLSISLLYLGVRPTPARLKRVEKSLEVLRRSSFDEINELEVWERIELRLLEHDAPGARQAIDEYLERYPQGRLAQYLTALRPKLDDEVQRLSEWEEEP